MKYDEMQQCDIYARCSAPLCPLDPEINRRVWYADEAVCTSTKHGKHRWVRKQRSIKRLKTKSWFGHPVRLQQLLAASNPRRPLTEEQKRVMTERLRRTTAEMRPKP
jgi:hypothetical protein